MEKRQGELEKTLQEPPSRSLGWSPGWLGAGGGSPPTQAGPQPWAFQAPAEAEKERGGGNVAKGEGRAGVRVLSLLFISSWETFLSSWSIFVFFGSAGGSRPALRWRAPSLRSRGAPRMVWGAARKERRGGLLVHHWGLSLLNFFFFFFVFLSY